MIIFVENPVRLNDNFRESNTRAGTQTRNLVIVSLKFQCDNERKC